MIGVGPAHQTGLAPAGAENDLELGVPVSDAYGDPVAGPQAEILAEGTRIEPDGARVGSGERSAVVGRLGRGGRGENRDRAVDPIEATAPSTATACSTPRVLRICPSRPVLIGVVGEVSAASRDAAGRGTRPPRPGPWPAR